MGSGLKSVDWEHELRPLTPSEFEQFRKLAYEQFGLDLRAGKEQLVSSRLSKRMRELGIHSYKDYYRHVVEDHTGEALAGLIDALTTNHTSFFREMAHFEFMRQTIIPALANRDHISIWSGASSTGEEPYSIAFYLLQELGFQALPRIRILATDISRRVLAAAQRGVYAAERFREVPPDRLKAFLQKSTIDGKDTFQVRKEIRDIVTVRRLNLMHSFDAQGKFPVIFCRNVMIYFDRQTQQDLVCRLSACLEPGGYLFIGHAESLNGLSIPLSYVRPAIYRKGGDLAKR